MKYRAKVIIYDDADCLDPKMEATGEFATLKEAKDFTEDFRNDFKYRKTEIKVLDLED